MFKSKKSFITIITALVLSFTLIGCGGTESKTASTEKAAPKSEEKTAGKSASKGADKSENKKAAKGPESLQFPSGSVGGGYYKVAGVIGKDLEPKLGIPVSVMPSGGSGENINLIEKGEAHIAIIGSNGLWPAWNASAPYDKKYKNFRLIAKLYENPTVFYALESSGIKTIKDLKGERVGVGASPKAFDHVSGPILEYHGISYNKDIKKVYVGFGDSATQIGDGLLDASIATAGMPALVQIASQKKINYITYDPAVLDKLSAEVPYFSKTTVKAGQLPGLDKDYQTFDMGGPYLAASKDLPDEFVYEITKIMYENISKMAEQTTDLKEAGKKPDLLAAPLGNIPFHPGAEKFWKEKGLLK